MTPDLTISIDQTLPLFSNAKSPSPPQNEKETVSLIAATTLTKNSKPTIADTVSISSQLRQVINEVKNEKTALIDAENTKSNIAINSTTSDKTAAKVDFVYDLNGDLITKYLDSSSRLIYQTPSQLMLRQKEADKKSDSSVSMKA